MDRPRSCRCASTSSTPTCRWRSTRCWRPWRACCSSPARTSPTSRSFAARAVPASWRSACRSAPAGHGWSSSCWWRAPFSPSSAPPSASLWRWPACGRWWQWPRRARPSWTTSASMVASWWRRSRPARSPWRSRALFRRCSRRRCALTAALRDGSAGAGSSRRASRLRSGLVVAEIAAAVALVSGSALLIRSFARLTHVDPGVTLDRVASGRIAIPGSRYDTPARRLQFAETLVARLVRQPPTSNGRPSRRSSRRAAAASGSAECSRRKGVPCRRTVRASSSPCGTP